MPSNFNTTFDGNIIVRGNVSAETFTYPAGSIKDVAVASDAAIDDGKTVRREAFVLSQTGAVVAETRYAHIMRAAGDVVSIEASVTEAVATGADRIVTIDLQKSTGAGAFATILSAAIVFNNGSTLRAITAGTISSAALIDNDMLRLVVTVAGAAGAQAQGLVVTVNVAENP